MVTGLPMSLSPPLPSPRVSKQAVTRAPSAAAMQETMTVRMRSAVEKPPRQLRRLPPISGSGGAKADIRKNSNSATASGAESAERAAKAWMRQALAKRVATRMLKRSTAPPPGEGINGGRKVLACCCARLPPGRGWMHAHRRRGGEDNAVAVVAPPRACEWAFSEYARWRRHVWMPSRFYLERVDADKGAPSSSFVVHGMRVDF